MTSSAARPPSGAATWPTLFTIPAREGIGRAKSVPADQYKDNYAALSDQMEREINAIAEKGEDAL